MKVHVHVCKSCIIVHVHDAIKRLFTDVHSLRCIFLFQLFSERPLSQALLPLSSVCVCVCLSLSFILVVSTTCVDPGVMCTNYTVHYTHAVPMCNNVHVQVCIIRNT